MEARNIEYVKLNQLLTNYAIDKLYDILERYGLYASKETIEEIENKIVDNKIISVDHPSEEDNQLFNGNIPIAHGGRTKNDGLIHVYPYVTCHNINNTEELFNKIIDNGIITHELFHFFIKLDEEDIDDENINNFMHFLNEGMVQLYTEELDKKNYPNNEYRKNIAIAKKLRSNIPEEYASKTIFRNTYSNIKRMYPEVEIALQEYEKLNIFLNKLKDLLKGIKNQIDIDPERIYKSYRRYSVEETVRQFKEQVIKYITNEDEQKNYINAIDELYQEFINENKKEHKM